MTNTNKFDHNYSHVPSENVGPPLVGGRLPLPSFVLIGSPGDRRVELFQAALAAQGLPPARLISYLDLLAQHGELPTPIEPGALVRIESPGKQLEVERALLAYGAEIADPEGERYERLSQHALASAANEKGRIRASRQWYLGYSQLLRQLQRQVPEQQLSSQPEDILLMFDKRACHALLRQHDIPVPDALEPVYSYDELLARMQQHNWSRVFIKPTHGSSASGIVAYRFQGRRHQAISTVEMIGEGEDCRLYNTRHIRAYEDQAQIAQLIDALCHQRVHVEQWLPRASFGPRVMDLRVVVIAGQAQHTVARLSTSPMTNLHLLNERGDLDAILAAIGEERWQRARQTCERAAQLFHSLLAGVDLLFSPSFKYHAIAEMNAFGDLLPGVLYHGQDTYTAQIRAMLRKSRMLCSTSPG